MALWLPLFCWLPVHTEANKRGFSEYRVWIVGIVVEIRIFWELMWTWCGWRASMSMWELVWNWCRLQGCSGKLRGSYREAWW